MEHYAKRRQVQQKVKLGNLGEENIQDPFLLGLYSLLVVTRNSQVKWAYVPREIVSRDLSFPNNSSAPSKVQDGKASKDSNNEPLYQEDASIEGPGIEWVSLDAGNVSILSTSWLGEGKGVKA